MSSFVCESFINFLHGSEGLLGANPAESRKERIRLAMLRRGHASACVSGAVVVLIVSLHTQALHA